MSNHRTSKETFGPSLFAVFAFFVAISLLSSDSNDSRTTGHLKKHLALPPLRSLRSLWLCTSPQKTDTDIWLTHTVSGLIRTLHFVQGRNPASTAPPYGLPSIYSVYSLELRYAF